MMKFLLGEKFYKKYKKFSFTKKVLFIVCLIYLVSYVSQHII